MEDVLQISKNKGRLNTNVPPLKTQESGSLSLLVSNHKPSSLQTTGRPLWPSQPHPHMQLTVR